MGRHEQHQTSYALVELEQVHEKLLTAKRTPVRQVAHSRALEEATTLLGDIERRLKEVASPRVPVADAAQYLEVSEPTVRTWLSRGVLALVPRSKPMLVDRASLRNVRKVVDELREQGQDQDWLRSLVDLLHDRAELNDPSIRRGLEELSRGELEQA